MEIIIPVAPTLDLHGAIQKTRVRFPAGSEFFHIGCFIELYLIKIMNRTTYKIRDFS